MLQAQTIKDWHILYNQNQPLATHALFDTIISQRFTTIKVLKDTYNSRVLLFEFQGHRLVVKYPTDRNQRKWIRFTTLFRKGEAKKAFLAFYRLTQLGISVPEPVLIAERHRCKMVVDGFLVYHYVAGDKCNRIGEQTFPHIVSLINELHANKLVHGDAHTANFNWHNGKITALDIKAKKAYFGKLSHIKDYIALSENDPQIQKYFTDIYHSNLYQTAQRITQLKERLIRLRKRIKKNIKRVLKIR